MSRLNISSCFTREFVAIGRRIWRFVDAAEAEAEDAFLGGLCGSVF